MLNSEHSPGRVETVNNREILLRKLVVILSSDVTLYSAVSCSVLCAGLSSLLSRPCNHLHLLHH